MESPQKLLDKVKDSLSGLGGVLKRASERTIDVTVDAGTGTLGKGAFAYVDIYEDAA